MLRLPKTKFSPPLPHRKRVHRAHLDAWLTSDLPLSRLTLVCAPAGYGKTTLLASLPELFPNFPLAWFALDAEDNDPVRFLAGMGEALAVIQVQFREEVAALLAASTGVPGGALEEISLRQGMVALINTFDTLPQGESILVLDDLHCIETASIYAALDYFIDKLPPGVHLVISSRSEPPLQLARLVARRQALTLRLDDLRFSLEECGQFLNQVLGLGLTAEAVQDLYQKTEGWPVGLVLLTSRQSVRTDAQVVDGTSFHYLAEEILAQQPEELRAILLETSILDEFTPTLCRQVTGRANAEELLVEISQRNLFLSLARPAGPEGEAVYRYHALFAEFLRYGFALIPLERRRELLLRAAQAEADPGRQIGHLLAAGAWEPAVRVIEEQGEQFLQNGYQQTVAAWIQALPAEWTRHRPGLAYVRGLTDLLRGNLESAHRCLTLCVQGGDPRTSGAALVYLASLAFLRAEFSRCAELIDQAQQCDPAVQHRVDFLMLRASLALFYRQDWAQADRDLRQAIQNVRAAQDTRQWFLISLYLAPEFCVLDGGLDLLESFCKEAEQRYHSQDTPLRLGISDTLAGVHLRRGRLRPAIECSRTALLIKEHLGGYAFLGLNAALTAAAACTGLGNYSAAQEYLDAALRQVQETELNQALCGGGWYPLGRLDCLQGKHTEAVQAYQHLAALEYRLPLAETLQKMLAGLLEMNTRHYRQAETFLLEAVQLQERERVSQMYGSARLLLAVLYERWERPAQALREIEVLFARDDYGAVAQDMPLAAPLLRLAVHRGVHAAQAAELLEQAGLSTAEDSTQNTLLTLRQLEILRLMAAGYSNQAIADQLVLSLATVKSHVVNIMNRLGVSSRMEAVARARQAGLL